MLLKLNEKSYICGAVHAGISKMYPLPEKVYRATESCTVLAVEADPRLPIPKDVMESVKNFKEVCKENAEETSKLLRERGIEVDCSNPFLAMVEVTKETSEKISASPLLGTERHLIPFFEKVIELEGVRNQVDIFTGIAKSKNAAEQFADSIMLCANTKKRDFVEVVDMIRDGEYDEILRHESLSALFGPLHNVLLKERNERMVDVVQDLEREGESVFFLPGAAHIGGPDGVVSIFRKRGCTVEAV